MIYCQQCKRTTLPREKTARKVIQTRTKVYPNGSVGSEIVREIPVCLNCAKVKP